ncbi:MBL fold metallo-hydrolase [Falsiroseomonas bella]|uniref:MBL fold metallo-hydrolase n=1 Tax=Falsiroseomonas bella TaxID=2184016 RepID=A0A317FG32_9PROT|nr:MBL fold metallo-hydrolase [Falsiroseomonas bella]PWS37755.1 MBL fold metallo-hydrolase [Falsiroseomonas bella]
MTEITRRAALAAGAGLALAPAIGAAQGTPEGVHRIRVGALEVFVIHDGFNVRADATQGFVVNAQPAEVGAALQAGGIAGTALQNPYNVTVLRTPQGLVMFDAGTGGIAGPESGKAPERMRAAGLDPAQVVLIVQTHFHGDHISGLATNEGVANFPNARIMVPEREWAFWTDAGEESRAAPGRRPGFAMVRQRFAAYQGKVTPYAAGAQVAPGVTAVPTPGHSPGHTSLLIADGAEQIMVIGDAVHAPALFMANPQWYPIFDMDPTQAVETRKGLLDRLATDRIQIIGYHFPMPATGRVERAGTGYRLVPSNA